MEMDVTDVNGLYAFFFNDKQVICNAMLLSSRLITELCLFRCTSLTKEVHTEAHIGK